MLDAPEDPLWSFDEDALCSPFGQVTSSFDYKVLNDPIHGHIQVPKSIMQLVDTPEFQRLRDLKQLGTLYFVFPGAHHNRFEHSIGTSYLAGKLINRLKCEQPELHITDRECYLIQVAGLAHDLGHGPFSHLFDSRVIPALAPGRNWSHEAGSEMMLEKLINDNGLEFDTREVKFLKDVISGVIPKQHDQRYLYQIISNSCFSVDVDKFDYLSRDCLYLGVKHSYDSSRLLNFSKVINGNICFHAKEAYNLYELFHTRYTLHKQIYSHRVCQSVDYMISDALIAADEELGIAESIDDPDLYLHMTDYVLHTIETSKSPGLQKSRDIIKRLRKRDLYKFVEESLLDQTATQMIKYKSLRPEDIIASYTPVSPQDRLVPEDLIVADIKINYAMKDENPVNHIGFFRSWHDKHSFHIPSHKVSLLIPDQYEERMIRLFCRHKSKVQAAQSAFRQFIAAKRITSPGSKRKRYDSSQPTPLKSQCTPSSQKTPLHSKTLNFDGSPGSPCS